MCAAPAACAALRPEPGFRLWLTAECHDEFPLILLQSSLKVTYEAPPGLKKNLMRTIEGWNENWFASGTILRNQVLLCAAHFHAIMQERRTYIPQGWTKFYEFSAGDLAVCCETVSMVMASAHEGRPVFT